MPTKKSSIGAIRLYEEFNRDNYILANYLKLPSKTNGIKDLIACGLKIKESAPFLYQLLIMKVENGGNLSVKEIEDIINIDLKYATNNNSRAMNDAPRESVIVEPERDKISNLPQEQFIVENPKIQEKKQKMKIPDALKNLKQ